MNSKNIFNLLILTFFCVLKINADSTTEKLENTNQQENNENYQQNYNQQTYASLFPYSSSLLEIEKQILNAGQQPEIQRKLPSDFSSYDKNNSNDNNNNNDVKSFNYDNEESDKPKPVVKHTDEQLNLSNPYLINSNIDKDGKEIPCLPYYPCKTNNQIEENINNKKVESNLESSVINSIPTTLQAPFPTSKDQSSYNNNNNNQGYPQINSIFGEPNINTNIYVTQSEYKKTPYDDGKFVNKQFTIFCYGLECSTQVKSSENDEQTKLDESSSNNNINYTPEFVKNYESQILKAIINDLQFITNLHLSGTQNINYNDQKPITEIEDYQQKFNNNIPTINSENLPYQTNTQIYV